MKAMRHVAPALVSVLLVACCCQATAAEESSSRWWPFGDKAESTTAEDASPPTNMSVNSTPSTSANASPSVQPVAPFTADAASSTIAPREHTPSTDYSDEELPERRWMFQSPRTRVSWPRIHMPAMPKPRLPRPQLWPEKPEADEARNAWVQPNADPGRPSPLQAVQQGAHRVGDSTRSAWRKTVDVLRPGDNSSSDSSRIARRETRSPFWKRMFTAEEPELQGPRTVTEWMAQDRLDP